MVGEVRPGRTRDKRPGEGYNAPGKAEFYQTG
jgi:hypothetical protein